MHARPRSRAAMAHRFSYAVVGIGLTLLLTGCDKPAPPSYVVSEAAQVVSAAPRLTLASDLTTLDDGRVFKFRAQEGAVEARMAYDGVRMVVEVAGVGAVAKDGCPVLAYVGQGAGGTRWEHRFGAETATVHSNGGTWKGTAPRAITTPAGTHRFVILTRPSDFALHVETARGKVGSCAYEPALGTLTGALTKDGGLRAGPAVGLTVVGVRKASGKDAKQDHSRYQTGDMVSLVGSGLAGVSEARFGDSVSKPTEVSARRLVVGAAGGGDTDSVVVVSGDTLSQAVHFEVEGTVDKIGDAMGALSGAIWSEWLVFLLVGLGIILTVVNRFPQIRGFWHAVKVVRGKYDNPDEKGEISHFQALTTALSATVGLGNIAGVAVAVTRGGPGAVFWMWVCGFLGMAIKFSECTLSTAYREVRPDGTVAGGPMYVIKNALGRRMMPLAFLFAILVTFASFGGGNMFQSNQAAAMWSGAFGIPTWVTGLILVVLVGLVILGGIKRIGRVTDKLVPSMCGIYVVGALIVIFSHLDVVPGLFASIFEEAFSVSAAVGGALGVTFREVIVQGFRRAAFSNEAGFGSAAIAHAAVKTDEPVREGVVALLEPFIDTIVICTMTALVILISGAWTQQGLDGVALTATAFDSGFEGFGSYFVPIAVFLFAISTMIAWSYYGEKGVEFVFGRRAIVPYRIVFVGLIFVGAVWKLGPVIDFSDAMLGLLVIPNLIAIVVLLPDLVGKTNDYFRRMKQLG